MNDRPHDIAVIGAGAAGLFAAIWAARTNASTRVVVLEGQKRLGAKILISGGGRCNVTHEVVESEAFAGSTPNAIRKILRRFDVPDVIAFFQSQGVRLKREATGKLFPITDRAQTIIDALLNAAANANVKILTAHRVMSVLRSQTEFVISGNWGTTSAARVILATGGKSVPKTGSDGFGYQIAESLGHSITRNVFPALVPLLLSDKHFIRTLSGLSAEVELSVRSSTGRILKSFRNSMLCTHFGISGPAGLDISRYWIDAKSTDENASLFVNWVPAITITQLEVELRALNRKSVISWLRTLLPERLARALCEFSGVLEQTPGNQLSREHRNNLIRNLTQMQLDITGNRGFPYAEVTAGGIPLQELNLKTMASRSTPGLYICGEMCDVDGRIGGYNFQWAWASGYVAGCSAGRMEPP